MPWRAATRNPSRFCYRDHGSRSPSGAVGFKWRPAFVASAAAHSRWLVWGGPAIRNVGIRTTHFWVSKNPKWRAADGVTLAGPDRQHQFDFFRPLRQMTTTRRVLGVIIGG